jgi:toxin ParE1/3/4
MANYTLSQEADMDITAIYTYSFNNFGEEKADAYLSSLENCLTNLAHTPETGRKIYNIRKGYRRYEHQNHSIFYKTTQTGVFIIRILHQRMDIGRYF